MSPAVPIAALALSVLAAAASPVFAADAGAAASPEAFVDPRAREVIEAAREATLSFRTLSYAARRVALEEGKSEPHVIEGRVWLERRDAPEGSEIPHRVRLEMSTGIVYGFDGEGLDLLLPEEKKLTRVSLENHAEKFITGNVVGYTVRTGVLEDDPYSKLLAPERRARHVGTENVDGVRCDVIESRPADTDLLSDRFVRYSFGVKDHLLRRMEASFVFDDVRESTDLVVWDLVADPNLPPGLFSLEAPDGYAEEVYEPTPRPELLDIGAVAPAWTLKGPGGAGTSLAAHRGKVVLLDFWGTWCAPCLRAIPDMQSLHEQFEDDDVSLLAISVNEPEGADPAGLIERKGCDYPVLLEGSPVAEAYHVTAFPTFYVLDRQGRVAYRSEGHGEGVKAELAAEIEKALRAALD